MSNASPKWFSTILFSFLLFSFTLLSNPVSADAVNYIETQANIDTSLNAVSDVAVSQDGRFIYTASTSSSAVSVFERDLVTGTLTYRSKNTGIPAAFSVDVSSDNKNVYAASPTGQAIHTFSRDITTGALTKVGEVTNIGGSSGFVSVSVSPDNKHVYGVGGYPNANGLVVFNRDQTTGALTVLHDYKDNVNDHALGQLFSNTTSPIKNIVTSADGQFVYVTSTADHAVTLFSRNANTGALTQVAVYKDGVDGVDGLQAASSAKRSPDGQHLYISGQGENSVAIFSINNTSGELTYLSKMMNGVDGVDSLTGARSLAVSPDGRYVLASAITDDAVTVFERNASTGLLTLATAVKNLTNGVTGLDGPSGMSTDPLNRHLYVAGQAASSLVVFSLPTPAISLSQTTATAQVQGAAVTLDNMLEIFDSDSNNLLSAVVSVESGFISTDTLAVQSITGITASYDSASGILALSGMASLADYQTVLRTLTYQAGADPSLAPGDHSTRAIGLQVTDEDGNTSATIVINVTVEKSDAVPATLSFNSQGGTAVANIETTAGANVTLPAAPDHTGHSFTGWNTAANGSGTMYSAAGSFVMPAVNTTLYAQWVVNQYTLTFDSAGGSAIAPITANFGRAITAPADPTKEGHAFTGWSPVVPATMPAQNMTFTASYTAALVTVTATVTGEASISPASQQVPYGSAATINLSLTNADDIVRLSSSDNCAAALSGNQIITAVLRADCAITVNVYPNTSIEKGSAEPLVSNAVVSFRFVGGAGSKNLSQVSLLRSGTESVLEQTDADALLTVQEDGSYLFSANRTGRYTLEFIDAVSGELLQVTFDVLPYLAFTSSRQPVQQDVKSTLRVWLSDEPIEYPVIATVVTDGASMTTQKIELAAQHQLRRTYEVTATNTTARITLQSTGITNAHLGTPSVHDLVVQQAIPALALKVTAVQNELATYVVTQNDGPVTLSASELNAVAATYSWAASGDLDLQTGDTSASFDPVNLAAGRYTITVNAESADGREGKYELALRVVASCPFESCAGISAIPASENAFAATPNRIPLCPNATQNNRVGSCQSEASQKLYAEVANQYQLTLGTITEEQSWGSGQFGIAVTDQTLADPDFNQLGLVINFDITGLEIPGEAVSIAIPLPAGSTIPANSVWRKYINGQWQNFVVDAANKIDSSARDALGQCPGVSSDIWSSGLTAGHACIRLTIEDGGPNDDDGQANNLIRDPGVLAVAVEPVVPVPPKEVKARSGGSFGALSALVLAAIAALRQRKLWLVAAVLPLSVSAQSVYLGADGLYVNSDTSSAELTSRLNQSGITGQAVLDNDNRSGIRLYAGTQITSNVAIEFGWLDLGSIDTDFTGLASTTSVEQLKAITPRSGRGVELSLLWQPTVIAERLTPGLRAGYWVMESKTRFDGGTEYTRLQQSENIPFVEAQLQWRLDQNWSLKVAASYYDVDNASIRGIQLGVIHRF
ncbi:6-phosphogluconolactonase (cycloisomerase 2 family) [Rheinheimera pacifica]|uniref:beta-propeller fold lactonase family protein n=1 Tax=Rheinheimera pacifica TaxID=173990 RepID=UPI0021696EB9|nr:beta-propeller fold lactonase family protein [Rheinheimera pacifica]MCS4306443.1 6-phosphogluconolactonase (cycloisomerase 2 family) [Rheinheimera pacifica]